MNNYQNSQQPPQDAKDEYVVKTGKAKGLKIKLFAVQPLIIQRVTKSIKMPERPTYEAVTMSGKTQVFPLDEVSAKDDDRSMAQWEHYQNQLQEAQTSQSERVIMAILTMGTECEVPEDGWADLQEILGIDVPQQKDARRASYLMYVLESDELTTVTNKIMRLTGVDESFIEQAEQSFRDQIPTRSDEQGEISDARGNAEENTSGTLATQQPF